jgi:hypothetical protein
MIYYIVGKKALEGTLTSDSANGTLSEYFELGWEYIASHFRIKLLYVNRVLNPDDVIVTLKDRMFLYSGFWNNVMPFEDFSYEKVGSDDVVVDLCDIIDSNREAFLPLLGVDNKYVHWNEMIDVLTNIDYKSLPHLNTKDEYCCIHIRYRGWATHRNTSADFWHKLIEEVTSTGINVYVFGKEAEKFANSKNVIHVSLEEYASLLNNKKCKFIVGGMSGGTLVAQTFAHKNCTQYVVISDEQTLREFNTHDAYRVFYHIPGMNFSEAPIKYVSLVPNAEMMTEHELIQDIKR